MRGARSGPTRARASAARALGRRLAALVLLLPAAGSPLPAALHDVHVSHTRAVVEGNTVALHVRLFADDLEATLRRTSGDAALRLGTPAADSAFARYFAQQVGVTADGVRLAPRVTGAGMANDGAGYPMRWFLVELTAPRPVRRLALRNALMFDTFRDQQNIVAVLRMPGERRTTLFFAAGDEREQVVPQ